MQYSKYNILLIRKIRHHSVKSVCYNDKALFCKSTCKRSPSWLWTPRRVCFWEKGGAGCPQQPEPITGSGLLRPHLFYESQPNAVMVTTAASIRYRICVQLIRRRSHHAQPILLQQLLSAHCTSGRRADGPLQMLEEFSPAPFRHPAAWPALHTAETTPFSSMRGPSTKRLRGYILFSVLFVLNPTKPEMAQFTTCFLTTNAPGIIYQNY